MLKRELLSKEIGTEHSDYYWKSNDGVSLYAQTWIPLGEIRGVITIIHGLGDHMGRYSNLAEKLGNAGYVVRGFDLRGHGFSEGKRGHARGYYKFLKDIELFLQKGSDEYPEYPQFLYGHSFGGNLVLNYAIQNSLAIRGIIVTSPWLELTHPPLKILLLINDFLSNFFPGYLVNNTLKAEDISRDLRVVHAYRTDNLVHNRISLRLFKQVYLAGIAASMSIYKVNVPLLVMHGTADNITSCRTTRNFVRNSSNRTTFIEWEGGYHELHNDLDKDKVVTSVIDWLNCQLN
jgi:alpha-beta hydrolase superfamily lysophospholipase